MAVSDSPVDIENLKGTIALGQQTLKSLELANGGAVIAILTFYGNLVEDGRSVPIQPEWISCALKVFSAGLALALMAAVCAYLSQLFVATSEPDAPKSREDADRQRKRNIRISDRFRIAAIVVALGSLTAFVAGTFSAAKAFS